MSEVSDGQAGADTSTNTNAGADTQSQGQESGTASNAQQTTWLDSLGEDTKRYIADKGFKSPESLAESYMNLEKLHSHPADRILKLPDSLEGEEASPIWEKLGKPKEASEYTFDLHESVGDKEFGDKLKSFAHKNNIPRAQFEGFINEVNSMMDEQTKALTEQKQIDIKNADNALRTEWAGEYEKNKTIVDQTAKSLGFSEDEVKALGAVLGVDKGMKLLLRLGTATGEAEFVNGAGSREDVKTPDTAKSEIKKLMVDTDFQRKLRAGDSDARNKWDRLHMMASPGEMSLT